MFMQGTTHWLTEELATQLAKEHVARYTNDAAMVRRQRNTEDCYEVIYLQHTPVQPGQGDFVAEGVLYGKVKS